jgi:crotonobetainyl-CoA:carnitine CoA-transferase CaiB-like acyl-CoA transferase
LSTAFAPGRADRWGIGADVLTGANPALVHCSITAFGHTGPYAKLKGCDSLVAAKAGLWARGAFGHRDGPILYPVPWASFGAAMQSVAGILGALLVRQTTGRGQQLSATLVNGLEPLEYFVGTIAQLMVKQGQQPTVDSRDSMAASRFGTLMITKDGRIVQISTVLPHQGRALCELAGIAQVLDEPRFSRIPMFDNADDAQAWEDMLWEEFRKHDLMHWLPLLEASPDVAFEVAGTSEEGLAHPQVVHNGDAITVDDSSAGPVRQLLPSATSRRHPSHRRGQHRLWGPTRALSSRSA